MIQRIVSTCLTAVLLVACSVQADEASVRKSIEPVLQSMFGADFKIEAVQKLPPLDLYELQVGDDLAYTDEKGSFLILGSVIDLKSKKNLTEERKNKLSQIKFSDLPLDLAIKQVKGNGKRVLATFEDPNCSYCKKLAKELQGMTNITIYTFVYPIFPQSSGIAKAIWCAPNRAKAWNDYLINGISPAEGKCDTSGVDKIVAAGKKLNIRGTPALFFADGSRVPGYMPTAQLEETLNRLTK
ncbi:MAG: DsbC family protein [Rhodocyclaceae bacterium]|nr:DsbC family protein [Rhodocyclaceae bacterium]